MLSKLVIVNGSVDRKEMWKSVMAYEFFIPLCHWNLSLLTNYSFIQQILQYELKSNACGKQVVIAVESILKAWERYTCIPINMDNVDIVISLHRSMIVPTNRFYNE